MAFNINEFSSQINAGDGVMRDNRFEFVIPNRGGGLSRYWADSVMFPGKLNATGDVRRYGFGVVEKRPYVTNFTQIQANFHNDNRNRVWGFLNDWMGEIIPHNMSETGGIKTGQYLVAYKKDYKRDMYINVYDHAGNVRSEIQIVEGFPSQISDVPLAWLNRDVPFIFQVQFDFLTWNITGAPAIPKDNA